MTLIYIVAAFLLVFITAPIWVPLVAMLAGIVITCVLVVASIAARLKS